MADEKTKIEHPVNSVPYVPSYGVISKALEKIKSASTPERFTQDFLSTKLGFKGGSAMPFIPFLKRTGFLNSDGTPTDLYKEFRNTALRGGAVARAMRKGFASLYEINEYVHDLNDNDLQGVIVQATGLDSKSNTVKIILGSFKALQKLADFEAKSGETGKPIDEAKREEPSAPKKQENARQSVDLKLGYTINLNLPPTSDIAVFDAIFKSLRENLLDE